MRLGEYEDICVCGCSCRHTLQPPAPVFTKEPNASFDKFIALFDRIMLLEDKFEIINKKLDKLLDN